MLLSEATQIQLVEELGRRLIAPKREDPPDLWCDDCRHFQSGTKAMVALRSFKPCAKKHELQFYVPQDHDSPETFGYYRDGCTDRVERPAPSEPLKWDDPAFRMEPPPRGKPKPA